VAALGPAVVADLLDHQLFKVMSMTLKIVMHGDCTTKADAYLNVLVFD
jgi:hypothetical protein